MATRRTTSRKAPARKTAVRAAVPVGGEAPVRLVFHEVDRARWGDFARLFESRGGPKACWCMVWRVTAEEVKHTDGASRRAAMERRVRAGTPVGILGYLDGEPVAWCSIAPRETHRKGLGGVEEADDAPGSVWSLTCLFVTRALRGQGVTRQLIDAAIAHARKRGARSIEAYPVDPESPSYRFMGFVGTFEAMGFREVGTVGSRRHIVRYDIAP
ncbi:N-acetyltransferase family protein [Pyxidicoccus sp. 3LFB2]